MDYERERKLGERRAKQALAEEDWQMAAYYLFSTARMTLRMAERAEGRTGESLLELAQVYEHRGDQALVRHKNPPAKNATKPQKAVSEEDRNSEVQWLLAERPATRLEDVAGMPEMKQAMLDHIIVPITHAGLYVHYKFQPGTGILMYGPPGTGKTFVARAIAGELDAAFIAVDMRKVLSKWFGETEQLLAAMFEEARKHERTVLFFDEVESLFPNRTHTNSSVMARVVPQLLQLISGIDPDKNTIILLGATNRPWLMDEAANRPGRFGKQVYIGLPDAEARAYLLERALHGVPTVGMDYTALANSTEGYSGADLAGDRDSLATEARLCAIHRTLAKEKDALEEEPEPEPVTMGDFEEALKRISPSVQKKDLARFDLYQREHKPQAS